MSLNDEQIGLWSGLVGIPSWVERETGKDETAAMQFVRDEMKNSGCRLEWMEATPDVKQLIAIKGTGSQFVLYLTAHLDVVAPDERGMPPSRLQIGKKNGRKIGKGLGAYDMKLGAAGMIDVMRRVDVPPWMTVVAAWLADEEHESLGALALIKAIKEGKLPKPDLIFSPEIPTLLKKKGYSPGSVPFTYRRRGHVKTRVELSVPQSHGGKMNAPNAPDEYIVIARMLRRSFRSLLQEQNSNPERTPQERDQREEQLRTRSICTPYDPCLSIAKSIEIELSQFPYGLKTVAQVIQWQRDRLEEFAKERKFTKRGVRYSLQKTPDRTCYEPYMMDINGKGAHIVTTAIDKAYKPLEKKSDPKDGTSTSDANLFAAAGFEVFESSARGGGEHTSNEWADVKTGAANFRVMEELASGRAIEKAIS